MLFFTDQSEEVDNFYFASWFQSPSLTAEADVEIWCWSSASNNSFWLRKIWFCWGFLSVFFVVVPSSHHPLLCTGCSSLAATICIPPPISFFIFISLPFWVWHSSASHVSLHPCVLCELLLPSRACIIIAEILRKNNSVFIWGVPQCTMPMGRVRGKASPGRAAQSMACSVHIPIFQMSWMPNTKGLLFTYTLVMAVWFGFGVLCWGFFWVGGWVVLVCLGFSQCTSIEQFLFQALDLCFKVWRLMRSPAKPDFNGSQ